MRRLIVMVLGLAVLAALFAPLALAQADENGGIADQRLQMWNVIAGFFAPLALSVIIQSGWNRGVQAVCAFGLSAVLAAVTTALEGNLAFDDWLTSFFVVVTATIATYHGLWKPTGVAPALKESTSFKTSA